MNEIKLAEKIAKLLLKQTDVIDIDAQIFVLNFVANSLREEQERQMPKF